MVCPRFLSRRQEVLKSGGPAPDMKWSVRELLEFSYVPGINEAYEGTWASGDPLPALNETLDYDWLEDDIWDNTNNISIDTG